MSSDESVRVDPAAAVKAVDEGILKPFTRDRELPVEVRDRLRGDLKGYIGFCVELYFGFNLKKKDAQENDKAYLSSMERELVWGVFVSMIELGRGKPMRLEPEGVQSKLKMCFSARVYSEGEQLSDAGIPGEILDDAILAARWAKSLVEKVDLHFVWVGGRERETVKKVEEVQPEAGPQPQAQAI